MRRVVWSQDALEEFGRIAEYIAQDSPQTALSVANRVDETIAGLAGMPTGRKGRVSGAYEKPVAGLPYIIAYALGEEARGHETITILRVIHGPRDWPEESWPG